MEIVKLLVNYGADVESDKDDNFSPLVAAAQNGHFEIVEFLIQKGAYVDGDLNHYSPIKRSLEYPSIVKLLLENGANYNICTEDGKSLLMLAILSNNIEVVELLLKYGVDTSIEDESCNTALSYTIEEGNEKIIKILSEHINSQEELKIQLFDAVRKQDNQKIKEFINNVDINATDENGFTALSIIYSGNKSLELIEILLKNGADGNVKCKDEYGDNGLTVFTVASEYGEIEIVKLLLENGVNPNIKDRADKTPLMRAFIFGHYNILKLLIENGARVDFDYNTQYTYADKETLIKMIELIEQRGI